MIDSHLHLTHRYFEQSFSYISMENNGFMIDCGNRSELIVAMKKAGISCCIEPAIDVDSNKHLLDLSTNYPQFIYPAVGNHPTRCIRSSLHDFKRVREFAKDMRVIAIGETGLDYHYDRKDQHRLRQKIWFLWQIRLADELELPLILHIRDAHDDAIKILRKNKKKLHGGVCHCFVGNASTAAIYTKELGLSLGIGGSLLMRPEISAPLLEAVKETPIEYLLLETDAPFVKPVKPDHISKKQWKKARNTSLILPAVAEKIARIKGIPLEDVMRITEENTRKIFRI